MVAAGEDTAQEIRTVHHVTRPAGSVRTIGHFQIKCTQSHRSGARRFEGGKSGAGKGSSRTGRGVSDEANSVGCEAFSASGARQSPDYAFTVGQITDHLTSDNGVVTLNVGGSRLTRGIDRNRNDFDKVVIQMTY